MAKKFATAIQAALVLFFIGAVIGFLLLFFGHELKLEPISIALSVPAAAGLLVILLTSTLPTLLPRDRISFPANFTLPVVHCALMAMLAHLVLTTDNALESIRPELAFASLWERWPVLVACAVIQVAAMTFLTFLGAPQ